MGLAKKSTTETLPTGTQDFRGATATKEVESGATAAIARLKKTQPKSEAHSGYKQRDFDAEARGKTRCALYGEIMSGPFIATLSLKGRTIDEQVAEIKQIVRSLADDGVAYTFGE